MKKLICLPFILFFSTLLVSAQTKVPTVDVSPLDVSYYPANYPLLKIQGKTTEPLAARVIYSRPQKNGRAIFGELIEYGKLWRLGANEATEIEFFVPVTIGTAKIKKGRYTLYAIPDSASWTIVLNKDTDSWGSFRYDEKKDLLRIKLPLETTSDETESFSMYFDKAARGFNLIMAWDKIRVTLPISH